MPNKSRHARSVLARGRLWISCGNSVETDRSVSLRSRIQKIGSRVLLYRRVSELYEFESNFDFRQDGASPFAPSYSNAFPRPRAARHARLHVITNVITLLTTRNNCVSMPNIIGGLKMKQRNRYGKTVGADCSGCWSKVVTFGQGLRADGKDDSAWCACDFPDNPDDMILVEDAARPAPSYAAFKTEEVGNQVEAHLTMYHSLKERWEARVDEPTEDEGYGGGFETHYEMSQWIGLWMKVWLDALPAGGPWDNYYDMMEAYCDYIAKDIAQRGFDLGLNEEAYEGLARLYAEKLSPA